MQLYLNLRKFGRKMMGCALLLLFFFLKLLIDFNVHVYWHDHCSSQLTRNSKISFVSKHWGRFKFETKEQFYGKLFFLFLVNAPQVVMVDIYHYSLLMVAFLNSKRHIQYQLPNFHSCHAFLKLLFRVIWKWSMLSQSFLHEIENIK